MALLFDIELEEEFNVRIGRGKFYEPSSKVSIRTRELIPDSHVCIKMGGAREYLEEALRGEGYSLD